MADDAQQDAKLLVQQLQRNPTDAALLARTKQALLAERRYKSFIKVMRWWAKRAPTANAGASVLVEAGEVAHARLKDDAVAQELHEAALALDPGHAGATAALAALRGDEEFNDLIAGFDAESVPPPGMSSRPPASRRSSVPPEPRAAAPISPPGPRRRSVPPPGPLGTPRVPADAAAPRSPSPLPPPPAFSAPPVAPAQPRPAAPVAAGPGPESQVGGSSFFPSATPSVPSGLSAPSAEPPKPSGQPRSPRVVAPTPAPAPVSKAKRVDPVLPRRSEPAVAASRPASEPARAATPAPGLPADGFEPQLFTDDEEDGPGAETPAAFPLTDIVGEASPSRPSRAPKAGGAAAGPVHLEVVRRRGDTVVGAGSVNLWGRGGSAAFTARRAGGSAYKVSLQRGATGWVRRAAAGSDGLRQPVSQEEALRLEPGDVAELELTGVVHRLAVVHAAPPPVAGREPVFAKRQGFAFAAALGIHLLGMGMIASLSSMGVSFEVENRTREEIFAEARMKPPEERPKPKLKKPKPVKLRKRKARPKPPQTEATAKIPKSLRKRLRKISRSRNAASGGNAVDRLVTALQSPVSGEGQTLKEVVSNIDAVKGGANSGAFRIGGTLSALEGSGPNIVSSGGGEVGTLGGHAATGNLTRLKAKKGGGVRGKVSTIKALAKVKGSLSRGEVQKVINASQHKMQRCYERALNAKPSLAGKLTYSWTIKTSGKVGAVRNSGNTMGDTGVAKCIAGVIKRMRFPRPKGGSVDVTYPFIFKRAM